MHVRLSASMLMLSLAGCGTDEALGPVAPTPDPGALVRVGMTSKVGVLLEEFPAASRDRIAAEILAEPSDFWIERARWQLRLTSVRLIYRKYYFEEAEWDTHNALPLPPEEAWNITLDPAGAARTEIDGHDLVVVGYTLESTLVTDVASPGISEPQLASVGGAWDEQFVFPVDPTLLLQRTGYACMSEDEFPAGSVDAEDAFRFYDDTCEVETEDTRACHFADLPAQSCVEALEASVGRVEAAIHYERVAWDEAIAAAARVGSITTPDAPDLKVLTTGEGLNDHRIVLRYVPADDCAVADGCVGGSGWRRLLVFDSHDQNVGGQSLDIGPVDYFNEGIGGELIEHNVYTYSACHEHFHFQYYGDFSFGSGANQKIQKNGFCIESTDRLSNNESTPLHTDYICENQGVSPGWGDLYGSSLVCNWVDITDLDTSAGPVTDKLQFQSNPDGFLCEGKLVKDAQGNQVWEPTEFKTEDGKVVDRPVCEQVAGTEENDLGSVDVTVPERGGFVSDECRSPHDLGPKRNCDFTVQTGAPTCVPGERVTLACTGGDADKPQVVRVCEASTVMATGMDCTFQDALANVVVDGASADVTFTCPAARDATEPGGLYAIYTAAVWAPDGTVPIACAP